MRGRGLLVLGLCFLLMSGLTGRAQDTGPANETPAPTPTAPATSSAETNLGVPAGLREGGGGQPPALAGPPSETNLGVPAGLREGGGGQPTTEAGQEEVKPPFEGPGWLDNALGLEDSSINVHGWIQNTFTGNTNGTPPSGRNFALFPNYLANQWMGNQYYLVFERPVEQNDRINFGFRIDAMFGYDWLATKELGFFDHAFRPGSLGFDMPQAYGEVHLPVLTKGGLDLKFGRWYSIAGYDQVPAVKRSLVSWPYFTTYFPFTFSGLMTTLHVTDRVNLYNAVTPGVDRWFNEHYRATYIAGLGWTSKDGKTSATLVFIHGPNQLPHFLNGSTSFNTYVPSAITPPPFLNGRRNLGYGKNDRTYFQNVVTHKWADKLTQAVEFDFAFENNTPGIGPGGTSENTSWYGAANWFLYEFSPKVTGVYRTEIFRDNNGLITGDADNLYEMTLGLLYKPRDWLWVRPEARYDWAQYHHPFSDGTRGSRLTLAIGVTVLF